MQRNAVMTFFVSLNNVPINLHYLPVSSDSKGYDLYENNIPSGNIIGMVFALSIRK